LDLALKKTMPLERSSCIEPVGAPTIPLPSTSHPKSHPIPLSSDEVVVLIVSDNIVVAPSLVLWLLKKCC